ncbi:hypothetical protein ACFO0N_12525 [Halobium salinum]|uniref:ATP-NAD kinase n=1 Tax=Halobium salinum TaxID=1364940 RepID=A0ABD5PDG3_9EURY|nr:hypothetical protein [Halobium salinum]
MNVALRGDDGRLADAVAAGGGRVVDGPDADLVLAVGAESVAEAARADAERPVLPVDADAGRYGVTTAELAGSDAEGALDTLLAGEWRTVDHPTASVHVADEPVTEAALDTLLVTTEPARISEYAVRFGGEAVTSFRADGVVVATPLGSGGYARAAGGPLLAPDAGMSVVPVSAFATRRDCWVAGDDVTLTVERDEGDVSLVVDGRSVRPVDPGERVTVSPDAQATLVHAPDLRPGSSGRGDWKNSNDSSSE